MTSQLRTWTGASPLGNSPTPPRKVNQQVALLQKDFTSAQQAVPVRLVYGRAYVAAGQITPIFGFRSEDAPQEGGGK